MIQLFVFDKSNSLACALVIFSYLCLTKPYRNMMNKEFLYYFFDLWRKGWQEFCLSYTQH